MRPTTTRSRSNRSRSIEPAGLMCSRPSAGTAPRAMRNSSRVATAGAESTTTRRWSGPSVRLYPTESTPSHRAVHASADGQSGGQAPLDRRDKCAPQQPSRPPCVDTRHPLRHPIDALDGRGTDYGTAHVSAHGAAATTLASTDGMARRNPKAADGWLQTRPRAASTSCLERRGARATSSPETARSPYPALLFIPRSTPRASDSSGPPG